MNSEEGHKVVRCHDDESLHRAKSLVNIQFSWFFIGVAVFAVSFYLVLVKLCGGNNKNNHNNVEYFSLGNEEEDKSSDDLESQKKSIIGNPKSFIHVGKNFSSLDIER